MKLKLSAVATAALMMLAATGAHANLGDAGASTNGSSSVAFVAMDNAQNISLVVDLGTSFANFLPSIAGTTSGAGNLSGPSVTAVWNLSNGTPSSNTWSINGVNQAGTFSWGSQVSSFLSNTFVGSNGYSWGVIAGDNQGSQTVSSTNVIRGQGLLFTSSTLDFDNTAANGGITSGQLNNGSANVSNYFVNNNNAGTNSTTVKGANTATAGAAFLGTSMAVGGVGDFGGGSFGANNFLIANTAGAASTSNFTWAASNAAGVNPTVRSLGDPLTTGVLAASPATFTWDPTAQTLTYTITPVPEANGYAMMFAGLAALGFVARRRRAAGG